MSDGKAFNIDLGRLKSREKDRSPQAIEKAERAGEELGFVVRDGQKRRGRKPSPRTGQVHAKVLPSVSEEIANEAKRRGVQQGVLIEEAWALYKEKSGFLIYPVFFLFCTHFLQNPRKAASGFRGVSGSQLRHSRSRKWTSNPGASIRAVS